MGGKKQRDLDESRVRSDESIQLEQRIGGRKPKLTDFPLDYKMEAVRLFVELGSNYTHTLKRLAERHPTERVPMQETLRRWIKQYEAVGARRVLFSTNPMDLWAEVELAALDKLLDDVNAGEVSSNVLYAIAGVAADKRLKMLELDKGKSSTVRHFHELVTSRREELVTKAQETMGLNREKADQAVEFQEEYQTLIPERTLQIDLDKSADKYADENRYSKNK